MPVTYQAEFHYRMEEDVALTRILPDGTTDTSRVNPDELHRLEDQMRGFTWNKSHALSRHIGTQLFTLLNGDRQTLLRALNEADAYSEPLRVIVKASSLPFELLYHTEFLVPSRDTPYTARLGSWYKNAKRTRGPSSQDIVHGVLAS